MLSYASNTSLLSKAMNGIDDKAILVLSEKLSNYWQASHTQPNNLPAGEWRRLADEAFFSVFFEHVNLADLPKPKENANPICDPPFGTFFQRLSLLDSEQAEIFNHELASEAYRLQPVMVDGERIAWLRVGKINVDSIPLAEHFFKMQLQRSIWVIAAGVVVALLLSALLARYFAHKITELAAATSKIAQRDYQTVIKADTGDELSELARHIASLAKSLDEHERQKQQWLGDIAHELRTPLTVALAEITAINDGVLPLDMTTLNSLHQEIERITRLVNDLHSLSCMDQNGLAIEPCDVDVGEAVERQCARFKEILQQKNIAIDKAIKPKAIAYADPDRLAQVVANILDNAAKYSNSGTIVSIKVEADDHWATITFEDGGPGVTEETLAQLFNRLYRADPARQRTTGGSGLGLAICKMLVEQMQGEIFAKQGTRGGLLMIVRLPVGLETDKA